MWISLIILVALAAFVVGVYNALVQKRVLVKEAWSGIDVQLKRRHDLIPNLVETVKGYVKHEKDVLENVTKFRNQSVNVSDIKDKAVIENNLTKALRTVFAVAEAYPDLKANQNFIDLQKNIQEIENEIQLARRYYNGTVRDYNIKVQTFPDNIVANIFTFKREEFFELDDAAERETPEVKF